jgi:TolB protein
MKAEDKAEIMRLYRIVTLILVSAAAVLLIQAPECRAERDYDYINISDPFLKKIPVAVPVFRCMTDPENERADAGAAAEILSDALDFTGYFKLIDRGAFLENLQKKGIKGEDLNFANWTDIGAELLITGGMWRFNGTLRMEIRLFDTYKGEMLFGKRYSGSREDLRKMVLRFCDELVYRLTGKRGLFASRIVFINKRDGKNRIIICDFDGSDPRRILESDAITLFPAFSPRGDAIAYTSYATGNPEIVIQSLEKESAVRIAHGGINITPTWVPENTGKLAATLSTSGDEEIYLLTEAGKIDKRVTNSWGIDVSPSFSPDGRQMAFVSKRSGTPQIYIKDLESSEVRRLTFEGNYNTEPDWSPDGDVIAYSAMENGKADICVIGVDGEGRKQLTGDAGSNESPSWSPDGSLIVFSSTRTGKAKLYVMTASGTDQRPLLDMPGEQVLPDWSGAIAGD